MQFKRNGVSVQVDDDDLLDMVLLNKLGKSSPSLQPSFAVLPHAFPPSLQTSFQTPLPPIVLTPSPPISSDMSMNGGVYAGNMRGRNGAPDYRLIVGPEYKGGVLKWQSAMDWAASVRVGTRIDFTLPSRAEQSLMFANVPELFEKSWYWSCEQHTEDTDYAWVLDFNGYIGHGHKDKEWYARAVRRVAI